MWSEERVSYLRRRWGEGASAREIAVELGGVTRNAVIGKVHRLGLQGRATPSRPRRAYAGPPRTLSPERARNMAITRWRSAPIKPPKPPSVPVDPRSPASLAAAALLASAVAADARRAMYRADQWGRTL